MYDIVNILNHDDIIITTLTIGKNISNGNIESAIKCCSIGEVLSNDGFTTIVIYDNITSDVR